MSKTTIPTGGITADAIDGTLIADDAVSEEHLDATALTGNAALAETPADTDEVLISDGGTLKRIDFSYLKSSNEPAWEVGLSSNQSINNSTHTRLAMTVLRANTSSTYWDSTNYKTQNLTAGKYYAWFNLTAESDIGASTIYLQIRHFNSSDSQQAAATLAAADFHRENGAAVVGLFNVSSGDYLDYTFWQNSGSATDQIYEAGDGSTCRGGGFKIA